MKDRIFSFIESKQLTPTEFADTIGVSRAAISSIKTGRTQPTLMLVEKIKEQFPEINVNWLIFGEGDMVHSVENPVVNSNINAETREFELFPPVEPSIETPKTVVNNNTSPNTQAETNGIHTNNENHTPKQVENIVTKEREVSKIILLYTDGTFAEFNK